MSDPYERAKGGRLSFKGGELAARKSSDMKKTKKHKKKKKKPSSDDVDDQQFPEEDLVIPETSDGGEPSEIYTIDAAKRMKYDELFPVEAKKFGYDPKSKSKSVSVEEALDDRVKKKADRYCK